MSANQWIWLVVVNSFQLGLLFLIAFEVTK